VPYRLLGGILLAAALVGSGFAARMLLSNSFKQPVRQTEGDHSGSAKALSVSGDRDIALLNLVAGQGLPGAEGMDVGRCLAELDRWARRARAETDRNFYRFRRNPAEFDNSEGYFRMLMLAVVVCEDFGVHYNSDRIGTPQATVSGDGFFADSRDLFLHGLLGKRRTGTCSSMPVLYVALARRLGYPVFLVTTKGHLFARWEGGGERFNVECTGRGMNRYDDAHYRHWPFELSDQEIRANGYLRSLGPAGELAVFLSLRGACLGEAGRLDEARQCYAQAASLAPELGLLALLAGQAQNPAAGPLAPPASGGALSQLSSFGISPVPVPEDPNPLKRLQPRSAQITTMKASKHMKRIMQLLPCLTLVALAASLQTTLGYYDPGIQRWINRDPILEPGFNSRRIGDDNPPILDPNDFRFAWNNANTFIDTDGLSGAIAIPVTMPPITLPPIAIPVGQCVVVGGVAVGGYCLGDWLGEVTPAHDWLSDQFGGVYVCMSRYESGQRNYLNEVALNTEE
jgi:hypothetical protein